MTSLRGQMQEGASGSARASDREKIDRGPKGGPGEVLGGD